MDRPPLNYLTHLAADSERFAEVLARVDGGARVPTCPDWNADDLVWHLAEVQWFWSRLVRHRPAAPDQQPERRQARPADRTALRALGEQCTRDLLAELCAAEPGERCWTWSEDQTVGFVYRRQAHEALIHRLDAELTAGVRTALPAELAADGIDEVLRLLLGGAPPGANVVPEPMSTVRLTAADAGHRWLVTLGRAQGERDGHAFDLPTLLVADSDPGDPAAATVVGAAEDLDCWLWNRPPRHALTRSGDLGVLRGLEAVKHDPVR